LALFLLVVFVGAALAFSLRAWMSYDEGPYSVGESDTPGAAREENTVLTVALVTVTIASSFVSELLHHSLKLSFLKAGAISLAILVAGQWLSFRFLSRAQHGEDGHLPVPPLSKPQS